MKNSTFNFLIVFLCSLLWGTISAQTEDCLNESLSTLTNTDTPTIPTSGGRNVGTINLGSNITSISLSGANGGLTLGDPNTPNISINPNTSPFGTVPTPYTVPVVVHILSNENDFNVTDAIVHEIIAELNESFSLQHPYVDNIPSQFESYAGDANISFCLAKKTPWGATTNGITRTYTPIDIFPFSHPELFAIFTDLAGGKTAWDTSKYLNIWICDLWAFRGGFSYSYSVNEFKDEVEFNDNLTVYDLDADGVVIDFGTFDPYLDASVVSGEQYAPGLIAHEVGHYFKLHHIWSDGSIIACDRDDNISDTPNTEETHSGKCYYFDGQNDIIYDGPQYSCSSEDMYMNYMSYAFCRHMFTHEQIDKMRSTLAVGDKRYGLTTSDGCDCTSSVAAAITPTHWVTGEFFYELELWTSIPAVSATWSGPPEVYFVGNTGTTLFAEVFTEEAFPITVDFTLENGCSYTRTINVNFTLPDEDGEGDGGVRLYHGWNDEAIFEVYPNPASNYIHILTNQGVDVQLYDLTGRLIYEAQQPTGIDVSNYEQGVYFIKTKVDGEEIVKKIIVR